MELKHCTTLKDVMTVSKDIFADDALGRLRLIGYLHDFKNLSKHIDHVNNEDQGNLNINQLTWHAFFPKLSMTFSSKENPLEIANSLDKLSVILKKELLLVQHKFEDA